MAELGPEVAELTDDGGERFDSYWGGWEHHRPSSTGISTTSPSIARDGAMAASGVLLVQHGLDLADRGGTGAFLVTSRPSNVAFYERRGFAIADEDDAPNGRPHQWFLRWERRCARASRWRTRRGRGIRQPLDGIPGGVPPAATVGQNGDRAPSHRTPRAGPPHGRGAFVEPDQHRVGSGGRRQRIVGPAMAEGVEVRQDRRP
jgi:hypothetical protein